MSTTEADIAAQLIERLLADPTFRAKFRRNPAVACREAGLHELADEMSLASGGAMHTLEMRESRSSLAGVMMAAAMEGMGVYEFTKHIAPAFEGIPEAVNDVLSRVNLPALPGGGALSGGSPPPAPLVEPADGAAGAGGAADAAAGGGVGGGGAAPEAAAPAPAAETPEQAAASGKGADAAADGKGGEQAADAAKAKEDPAAKAAEKIAQEESPEAKEQAKIDEGLADAKKEAEDLPEPTDLPSGPVPLHEAVPAEGGGGGGDAAAAAAQPAAPAAQAPAPAQLQAVAPEQAAAAPVAAAADAAPSSGSGPIDPAQFGAEGTGGPPSPEAEALLHNKNVVLDAAGMKDLKEGRMDPRIVSVLTRLSQDHKLTISATSSDHGKFTAGGSISNHHVGRGVDIAAIDGVPVSASNFDAREMASHLIDLDQSIRPSEIGSPFAIAGPAFFTDAAHQNHIHVGFDDAVSPDFKPPADVAASGAAPAAAAPAAAAVAPGTAPPAAAPPPPGAEPADPHDSGSFLSVKGEAKAAAAEPRSPQDSQGFLKAVAPEQPRTPAAVQPGAPAAADAAVPAGDLSAVPDAYPGDGASKEQIAAWMAKQAEARGLPRQLPVMASLVESGLTNIQGGDRDSVGFFQMRVGIWDKVPAYHGYSGKPELQVKWFLDQAEAVKKQRIANGQPIDDPKQFGEWIADVERPAAEFRGRYQLRLDDANGLLAKSGAGAAAPEAAVQAAPAAPGADAAADAAAVAPAGGNGSSLGAAALKVAQTQRGVREIGGANMGPQVEEYLKAAQVAPGNPWCASFITWSLEQAGHKMPGGGWAAVATWVHNAEAGNNGLKVVSADEARPGDIVAYDFGGQSDFGADGHIGFLDSTVKGGQFTALEGNNADAVNHVPRSLTAGNVKFLRIEGNAPAGAAAPAAAAPGAAAAVAPGAPAAGAVPPPPVAEPADPHQSGGFLSVKGAAEAKAEAATPRSAHESQGFLKAVTPEQPRTPAAVQPDAPAPAAADAAAPAGDLSAVPDAYPGNDAPKAELAAWMAKEAEKRGLPHELPVMASLVESGLTNIQGGDRDSVGFFQMRTGIWDKVPAYHGYADKPELQIKWFLDQAEAVKKQRIANGQPIDDPKQYGEWIADVERPAAEFRGRYQLRLDEAQSLLKQAPETPAAAPEAAAQAPTAQGAADVADAAPPPALATSAAPQALAAVKEAEKYLGTPYKYGGSSPQTGFDCSGLMQWAYAQSGIKIPRVTYTQIDAPGASPVRRSELLPGDLVFFRDPGGDVHHVGMSLGGDKFIHAPHTGDVVKVSSLNERYYSEQFTGGRRFAQAVAGAPAPAAAATPEAAAAAPAAPAAPATPAAPAIDPRAVAEAKAAAARDAAEARRHNSGLFMKIQEQENRKENERRNSMMFLRAIKPEEAKAAADAAAPAPTPPPADPAPAAPAAVEPAQPAATAPASPEVAAAATPPDLADVAAEYPGNNASQELLAKWLAKEADKHGLPPELPVMASLVESGVKNLNFGDRDSVGFFQMRVGIWNKGEYAGFPDHPELQIKWFIDNAVAVKKQRIAAGDANFGKDPSKWGEWIADVERPAEQFRGRYQLRLDEARELLS